MSFHGERLDAGGCVNSDESSADVQPTHRRPGTPRRPRRRPGGTPRAPRPTVLTHQTFTSDAHTPYPFDVTDRGAARDQDRAWPLSCPSVTPRSPGRAGGGPATPTFFHPTTGTTPERSRTGTPLAARRSPTATARSPPWYTSAIRYRTQNFACSAAMTYSYNWQYPRGWRYKPGVDLYCNGIVWGPRLSGGPDGAAQRALSLRADPQCEAHRSRGRRQRLRLQRCRQAVHGDLREGNSGCSETSSATTPASCKQPSRPQKRHAIEDDIYDVADRTGLRDG